MYILILLILFSESFNNIYVCIIHHWTNFFNKYNADHDNHDRHSFTISNDGMSTFLNWNMDTCAYCCCTSSSFHANFILLNLIPFLRIFCCLINILTISPQHYYHSLIIYFYLALNGTVNAMLYRLFVRLNNL